MIKKTKQEFFDTEIVDKNSSPQELINQVKKIKLLAIKVIKHNGHFYLELNNLWQALHELFNSAQHQQVNMALLKEILNKTVTLWISFAKEKFSTSINKYNNTSTLGPNKLS